MATCKLLAQITIDSTNNTVEINDSGGDVVATVPSGTYFIAGLLTALQAAMNSVGSDGWTVTLGSSYKVTILCDASWSVDWDHDAPTEALAEILGIDSTSHATWASGEDALSAITADYQHQYGWYSSYPVARDWGREPISIINQHVYPAGATSTTQLGDTRYAREVEIQRELVHKARPTSGYNNQDWESFLEQSKPGRRLRYYPDIDVTTAYAKYSNQLGYFDCKFDTETMEHWAPPRETKVSLWSWKFRLLSHV